MELSKSEYEVATMLVRALVQHGLKCYGESQADRLFVDKNLKLMSKREDEWAHVVSTEAFYL